MLKKDYKTTTTIKLIRFELIRMTSQQLFTLGVGKSCLRLFQNSPKLKRYKITCVTNLLRSLSYYNYRAFKTSVNFCKTAQILSFKSLIALKKLNVNLFNSAPRRQSIDAFPTTITNKFFDCTTFVLMPFTMQCNELD